MPTAKFTITDNAPGIFEVRWSWWGREQYLFDGVMLQSLWDLSTFTGARTFHVGGHNVRIAWSAKERFLTRVYVDDVLRVEDLFPLPTSKREQFSWARWLKTVLIWMIIGMVGTVAYKYWTDRQSVTPSNALERS